MENSIVVLVHVILFVSSFNPKNMVEKVMKCFSQNILFFIKGLLIEIFIKLYHIDKILSRKQC